MRYSLIVIILFFITQFLLAQNKLILQKRLKKTCVHTNQTIGITIKGEPFVYSKWRTFFDKDTHSLKKLYFIDSISKDYLVVKKIKKNSDSILYRINYDSIVSLTFSKSITGNAPSYSVIGGIIFLILTPFQSIDHGKIDWGFFIAGTGLGTLAIFPAIIFIVRHRVKTYKIDLYQRRLK